jgi:hypothetical protein
MTNEQVVSLFGWVVGLILGGILYIAVLMIERRLGKIQRLLEAQPGRTNLKSG